MSLKTRPVRPVLHVGLIAALAASALACGSGGPTRGAKGKTPADNRAAIRAMLSREAPPVRHTSVELLDGLVVGDVESRTPPRPECKKTDAGEGSCVVRVDLGKDADGDPFDLACTVTTDPAPFGVMLGALTREVRLDETPRLHTTTVGEGLSAMFVANTTRQTDEKLLLGTAKLAALYAHGYMAMCVDEGPGGRASFDRVVTRFFRSLKFKDNPERKTLFAFGHKTRVGDRTAGFRHHMIAKPADGSAFLETSFSFSLETDGKTWSTRDMVQSVERDAQGGIERVKELGWFDGKGPAAMSARPSEDKRYHLKFEVGAKSTGLESTPRAPLNTELWGAPELSKVASGAAPSYKYAILDLADGEDPSFGYVTVTRREPGVLYEEVERPKASKKASAEPVTRDELHVDARGLVVKEISKGSVAELVHTWGELPVLSGIAPTTERMPVSRKSKRR